MNHKGRTINDLGGGLGQKREKNSMATRAGKKVQRLVAQEKKVQQLVAEKKKFNKNSLPEAPPDH